MRSYLLDQFVAGIPAPYSPRDVAWKDRLAQALASVPADSRGVFVELDFAVAPVVGYPYGADIDNLCHPVFRVLAGRLGWFRGSGPNVLAFRARKTVSLPTGCRVRISDASRPFLLSLEGETLLDESQAKRLPTCARDASFVGWVQQSMMRRANTGGYLGVDVRFAARENIAEIPTGNVKKMIDCLQPILGGRIGAPDDSRVVLLQAVQADSTVPGLFAVRVVQMPA